MRKSRVVILCLVHCLVLGTMILCCAAEVAKSTIADSPDAASVRVPKTVAAEKITVASESKQGRIREGSKLVDQIGEFQKSGDQINFFAKQPHGALRVLENLALERVVRVLDDNPAKRVWSVTGVITEFRGENYLLVTRAVLKAQPKSGPSVENRKAETGEKKDE